MTETWEPGDMASPANLMILFPFSNLLIANFIATPVIIADEFSVSQRVKSHELDQ